MQERGSYSKTRAFMLRKGAHSAASSKCERSTSNSRCISAWATQLDHSVKRGGETVSKVKKIWTQNWLLLLKHGFFALSGLLSSYSGLFQFDAVSYSARKRAWSYLYKRTQHPDQVLTRTCSGPGQQQLSPDVLPESQPDTLFDTIQVNYGRLGLPRVWLVHHTTQLVVVPETRTKLSFLPLDLVETNPVLGKMAEFQTDRVQARKLRHRICYSNSAVLWLWQTYHTSITSINWMLWVFIAYRSFYSAALSIRLIKRPHFFTSPPVRSRNQCQFRFVADPWDNKKSTNWFYCSDNNLFSARVLSSTTEQNLKARSINHWFSILERILIPHLI